MTELETVREYLTEYLNGKGIRAMTAWPGTEGEPVDGPVAVVSLRCCETGPGGFRHYLGERYDQKSQTWREVYGQRVRATFGLDLYAGRAGGAAGCQRAFDALAEALGQAAPAGLRTVRLNRGETVFDPAAGAFRCPVEAVCNAYLYAMADEAGAFLDFEVKGYGNDGP